ncbi:hypothetical protein ARTHRO9AX_180484 [Arthrobacter sp. 9AX]|nr:hypothetical protein ARTHRO9AX_180484 [Arthrobacter sp. 9AX]
MYPAASRPWRGQPSEGSDCESPIRRTVRLMSGTTASSRPLAGLRMREPAEAWLTTPAPGCPEAAACTGETAEDRAGVAQPDNPIRLDTAMTAAAPDMEARVRAMAFRMWCLSGLHKVSEQSCGTHAGIASDFAH